MGGVSIDGGGRFTFAPSWMTIDYPRPPNCVQSPPFVDSPFIIGKEHMVMYTHTQLYCGLPTATNTSRYNLFFNYIRYLHQIRIDP